MTDFIPLRVVEKHSHGVSAVPEEFIELLCPVRERDWLEPWDCVLLHSRSGRIENNCVFRTSLPGDVKMTWMVTRYEPAAGIIEFAKMNPSIRAEKLDIRVEQTGDHSSVVNWIYTFTGLSEEGNRLIEAHTGDAFQQKMLLVEASLCHYIDTGEMLRWPVHQ